ncbi:MAG: diguanylate cyclase [Alphaproteobacteria bacterium]|nr:diguanylate cyclase [Alphaproteobacteria bacterium]
MGAGEPSSFFSENGPFSRFPAPAFTIDRKGDVIECNSAGEEIIAALGGDAGEKYLALVESVLITGDCQSAVLKLPELNELCFLEFSIIPLGAVLEGDSGAALGADSADDSADAENRQACALVLCRDITLERNLRTALVDSRQRYKDLVEASSDFAWETDDDGAYVFVSPRGALGYSAEELVGRQADDMVIGENLGDLSTPFSSRVPLDNAELWFRRADGRPTFLQVSCVPLYNDEGDWVGVRGICRDVTEERERDAALARAHHREQLLNRIVREIRDEIVPQKMMSTAASVTAQELNASGCRLYRIRGGHVFVPAAEWGTIPKDATELVNGLKGDVDCNRLEGKKQLGIAMPTRYHQKINGAICLWRESATFPWSGDDQVLLGEIADQLGIAIEQVTNHEELERISSTDALTGLLNRRTFFATMRDRISHAKRTSRVGVMCYVDFDNFKLVNDIHGHKRGDEALKKLTEILGENTRANDLIGRLGGDEFGIWLEETDEAGARANAEKLIESSEALRVFSGAPDHPLGISIGIAVFHPESGERLEDLVSRADDAMYAVKNDEKGGFALAPPAETSANSEDSPESS